MQDFPFGPCRATLLAACLLAAPVALGGQSPATPGAGSTEPGTHPMPDSSRMSDGDSATQAQSDSNPKRPSASPGERLRPPTQPDQQKPAPAQADSQPMPGGQGQVKSGQPGPDGNGQIPGGSAGSGGHKHGSGR